MIPVLQTPRLRLRPPHSGDLENIYQLANNPRVMQYINGGESFTWEEARLDLEKRIQASKGKTGYWIVETKCTGEFIGWCALKPLDNTSVTEVGYRFSDEFWGKGYATEASKRLLEYGFLELGLPLIVAVARPKNKASIRVMEKIGLTFERTGVFYQTACVLYSLSRELFLSNHRT